MGASEGIWIEEAAKATNWMSAVDDGPSTGGGFPLGYMVRF